MFLFSLTLTCVTMIYCQVVVWRRYNDFKKLYKAMFHLHRALQRREDFPPFARSKVFGEDSSSSTLRQEPASFLGIKGTSFVLHPCHFGGFLFCRALQ